MIKVFALRYAEKFLASEWGGLGGECSQSENRRKWDQPKDELLVIVNLVELLTYQVKTAINARTGRPIQNRMFKKPHGFPKIPNIESIDLISTDSALIEYHRC